MANTFTPTALANGTSNLLVRASALNQTTDLLQAGVVFNDAVRASTGLFSTPQNSGNSNPFLGSYTTDIHAVQNDIAAMLANPGNVTINGNAFTLNATDTQVLTAVQNQLTAILNAAPQTTNAATLAAADQIIHTNQMQILQEINGDAHLANALANVTFMANTGANDVAFQSLPVGTDDAAALANATAGTSLKAVGMVFNAGADLALGGINANNLAQIQTDFTAVHNGLLAILNSPTKLAAIEKGETAVAAATTTLHLQTVADQIMLQINKYDANEVNANPTALRGTADNILDMIDVIQNDANLNMASGGNGTPGHVGGFAEMPGGLTGTVTKFQDNQAQTNFWATFLSEANTLAAQLTAVANGTAAATMDLVTQIQNYQNFGVQFDMAQGAVFQGRFDNELVNGGLQSDSNASIKALMGILNGDTGAALAADHAMLTAAAQGFVGNAGDIAGNNVAIGGSAYVGSATTIATATVVNGIGMGTGKPVGATPNIANGTGGAPATSTSMAGGTTAAAGGTTAVAGANGNGNGTGNGHAAGTSHHHAAMAAAATTTATAASHASATSHATDAAHSSAMDMHHFAHMWG
jgi:hypothetical protein